MCCRLQMVRRDVFGKGMRLDRLRKILLNLSHFRSQPDRDMKQAAAEKRRCYRYINMQQAAKQNSLSEKQLIS
jgi:hypothetical protein